MENQIVKEGAKKRRLLPILISLIIGVVASIVIGIFVMSWALSSCGTHCDLAVMGGMWYSFYFASLVIPGIIFIGLLVGLIVNKNFKFFGILLVILVILFLLIQVYAFPTLPIGHNTYKLFNYQKTVQLEKMLAEVENYHRNCTLECNRKISNKINSTIIWQEEIFAKCISEKGSLCNKKVKENCLKIADLNIRYYDKDTNGLASSCFSKINEEGITEEVCNRLIKGDSSAKQNCIKTAKKNMAIKTSNYDLCPDFPCRAEIAIRNKDIGKCREFEDDDAYWRIKCFSDIDKSQVTIELCDKILEGTPDVFGGREMKNGCYGMAYYNKAMETKDVSYCEKIHDNVQSRFIVAYQWRKNCYAELS